MLALSCDEAQREALFIGGRDEKIVNRIKTLHETPPHLGDDGLSVSSCDGLRGRGARLSSLLPSIFDEILRKISKPLNPYR
jgi:hypothetical protein